jgi:hypothetical protein
MPLSASTVTIGSLDEAAVVDLEHPFAYQREPA